MAPAGRSPQSNDARQKQLPTPIMQLHVARNDQSPSRSAGASVRVSRRASIARNANPRGAKGENQNLGPPIDPCQSPERKNHPSSPRDNDRVRGGTDHRVRRKHTEKRAGSPRRLAPRGNGCCCCAGEAARYVDFFEISFRSPQSRAPARTDKYLTHAGDGSGRCSSRSDGRSRDQGRNFCCRHRARQYACAPSGVTTGSHSSRPIPVRVHRLSASRGPGFASSTRPVPSCPSGENGFPTRILAAGTHHDVLKE